MRGKQGNTLNVKNLILDTASHLFTISGIHGTSLNDIATAANLSKGTLYYYYPTKDSLIMDIADIHAAQITDLLFTWVDNLSRRHDMSESLRYLIDTFLSDNSRCKLHIVLCAECCLDSDDLREFMLAAYKKWAVMLEVGTLKIQSKESAVLRERSALFFKLLTGMITLGNIPAEEERDSLVKLILH